MKPLPVIALIIALLALLVSLGDWSEPTPPPTVVNDAGPVQVPTPVSPPEPAPALITTPVVIEQPSPQFQALQTELLDLTNRLRSKPLSLDQRLIDAAQEQADYLAAIGHDLSTPAHDLNGTLGTRAAKHGFTGSLGENLAGSSTAAYAVRHWSESQPHYATMTGNYDAVGFGYRAGRGGPIWCAVFGRDGTSAATDPKQTLQVIAFHADWCSHCRSAKPTVDRLERDGWGITRMDIETEWGRESMEWYKVRNIPAFIVITHGKETFRTHDVSALERQITGVPSTPAKAKAQPPVRYIRNYRYQSPRPAYSGTAPGDVTGGPYRRR